MLVDTSSQDTRQARCFARQFLPGHARLSRLSSLERLMATGQSERRDTSNGAGDTQRCGQCSTLPLWLSAAEAIMLKASWDHRVSHCRTLPVVPLVFAASLWEGLLPFIVGTSSGALLSSRSYNPKPCTVLRTTPL